MSAAKLELSVEQAMERLLGDDLVRAQRWPQAALKGAQVKPRQIADDFILTWAQRAQGSNLDATRSDELYHYLRREAIPRRVMPAAGRAQRLSSTGLLRKVIARPDGFSTVIQQAREPLGWGGSSEVIVLDATLACQVLRGQLTLSTERLAELATLAERTLRELSLDLQRIGRSSPEHATTYLSAADRLERALPLASDLVGRASAWLPASGGLEGASRLVVTLERLLMSELPDHEVIARTVWEHLTSVILRPLLHEPSCVDATRARELFGERVILTTAPPNGPGGALYEGVRRLRELGALDEHSYIMPVYSDYASASLDLTPNVYVVALLRGLARPEAPHRLPRALVGLKSPVGFSPRNKGLVLLKDPARPELGARAVREWRDLDEASQRATLLGFGRTLCKQGVPRGEVSAIEDWEQSAEEERALITRGYDEEAERPTPAPFAHALNAGVFLFERELLEQVACRESGSIWAPLSAYDHPDHVKGKTHEYWYTDLIEAFDERGEIVAVTHFGVESPSGLKDMRRVSRYREARAEVVRRALIERGVELERGAHVSISNLGLGLSISSAVQEVFQGGALLRGRVHLDADARVGDGVELDGRVSPVALLGHTRLEAGVCVRGEVLSHAKVEVDHVAPPPPSVDLDCELSAYALTPLRDTSYRQLSSRGLMFTQGATLTLLSAKERGPLSEAEERSALDAIFLGVFTQRSVDQVRLDGAVYLSTETRVEHGVWLSGLARPLITRGRVWLGRGWRVAASTLIDVELSPAQALSGLNYSPPKLTDRFALWGSHLERVKLKQGEEAHGRRLVGSLLDLDEPRSLLSRLLDPLELRALEGPPVRAVLSDLDKTAAYVSDGLLTARSRERIRAYLSAGGSYGLLTSRDEGSSRFRLAPEQVTLGLSSEARARLEVFGRFGARALGDRVARRSQGRALTLARIEEALIKGPLIPAYRGAGEAPRALELGTEAREVTDATVALRNLDMAIYQRGDLDIYVMRDVPEREMSYAIITVYRARNRAPLGPERDQYDPRPALIAALSEAFPGAELTSSGFGTLNLSWMNKSDLVEHIIEERSALSAAEVAFLDDEGDEHGTGRKALELAARGVVTVLVGEGDATLSEAVIKAARRGPDAHDRFLELQASRLLGEPTRLASDEELRALAELELNAAHSEVEAQALGACLQALERFELDHARYQTLRGC